MVAKLIRSVYAFIISHNLILGYRMNRGLLRDFASKRTDRGEGYDMSELTASKVDISTRMKIIQWICTFLDYTEPKILAIDEFATINTENTIVAIERAIREYE